MLIVPLPEEIREVSINLSPEKVPPLTLTTGSCPQVSRAISWVVYVPSSMFITPSLHKI